MAKNEITTATGRNINPLALKIEDVDIYDIAHSLAMICRFNGHSRIVYSVAEHSVLVSTFCPPELALEGLLHDAAEAYLGDVPTPLKRQWPEYQAAERRAQSVITKCFGLPAEMSSAVNVADKRAIEIEMPRLLAPVHSSIAIAPLCGFSPDKGREAFLARYSELTGTPLACSL